MWTYTVEKEKSQANAKEECNSAEKAKDTAEKVQGERREEDAKKSSSSASEEPMKLQHAVVFPIVLL